MKFYFLTCLFFLFLASAAGAQEKGELFFIPDTMMLHGENKVLKGEYVETTLKNLSVVRLFKTYDNKYFLRLLVTKNFYFDKVDVLEIRSGRKSYFNEHTRQFKVNKTLGLYILEVPKNYLVTLKDEGITSVVFAKAETDFTRHDASEVRKIARFFYESITGKK